LAATCDQRRAAAATRLIEPYFRTAPGQNDATLIERMADNGYTQSVNFLRIARGTLADAKTTIEELYAWEFDGPFLYDFTGRKRPAGGGEAGAIGDATPRTDRAAVDGVDPVASGPARTSATSD
jgi:hypothetical protein